MPVIEVSDLHKRYRGVVVAVDDHPIVRDGLRGVFAAEPGFEVVGEASNGTETVERASTADVVLMDLRMPGIGGVEAITALRSACPEVRVLVLTTFDTDSDVVPAIEADATGYLLKDAPREVLALVADGTTNREAAKRLFVSEATHRLHIYDKLGVRDRAAAVSEAYKRDLLS